MLRGIQQTIGQMVIDSVFLRSINQEESTKMLNLAVAEAEKYLDQQDEIQSEIDRAETN